MRGSIGPGTLIAVVRALCSGQKSGILQITHGEEVRKLLCQKGTIKFATTNLPQERLGDYLLKNSRLTAADLEKATIQVGRGERIGQILVRLKMLTAEELTRFARDHVLHIIFNSFAAREGEYSFEEADIPLGQEIKAGLSTAGMIMEAVRRIDPAEAARLMKDEKIILRPSISEHMRSQPISLGPQEGYLMSRVDGNMSVGEIISLSPLPAAETLRTLLGLWSAGLIEDSTDPLRLPFDDAAAVAAQATASAPPALASSSTASSSQSTASGASPTPKAASGRTQGGLRRKIVRRKVSASRTGGASSKVSEKSRQADLSREVIHRHKDAQEQNLYDVLGIMTTADESDIRRAYYGFAKRLHPDRFQAPEYKAVCKQAEHLFSMLTEAYNVLTDPEARKQYDEHHAAPAKASPAERKQEQSEMARQNFLYGKAMLQKGKFHEAVKFFENALKQDDKRAEYYQYLGSVQMKNPAWRRDAEKNFIRALEIDPSLVTCYVNLGNIYLRLKKPDKAELMFQAALQWDPDQPVAKRELEQLGGLKSGAGVGSVFKGIFKK